MSISEAAWFVSRSISASLRLLAHVQFDCQITQKRLGGLFGQKSFDRQRARKSERNDA